MKLRWIRTGDVLRAVGEYWNVWVDGSFPALEEGQKEDAWWANMWVWVNEHFGWKPD